MATLLDAVGTLQSFGVYSTILPFLLITAVVYAVLLKYKTLGENKTVNAIIAIVIGLVFISVARAVNFINIILPFVTIFLVMLVLVMLIFTFMGVKGETISDAITKYPAIIFIFILIFVVIGVSQVFPETSVIIQSPETAERLNLSLTEPGATPQQQGAAFLFLQFARIFASPQVLGLIILFIVFAIGAYFITREPAKGG